MFSVLFSLEIRRISNVIFCFVLKDRLAHFRKKEIKRVVFVSPTSPQPRSMNKIEDYGLKYVSKVQHI